MSINWDATQHFERKEFDDPNYEGSGDCIDGGLLVLLVRLRKSIESPIIIHGKVGGAVDVDGSHGHADDSFHLKKNGCMAVDCHFNTSLSTREQCYYVLTSGFSGIGMYYNWSWDGNPLKIGFHLDIRPKTRTQLWNCFEKGKYIYILK